MAVSINDFNNLTKGTDTSKQVTDSEKQLEKDIRAEEARRQAEYDKAVKEARRQSMGPLTALMSGDIGRFGEALVEDNPIAMIAKGDIAGAVNKTVDLTQDIGTAALNSVGQIAFGLGPTISAAINTAVDSAQRGVNDAAGYEGKANTGMSVQDQIDLAKTLNDPNAPPEQKAMAGAQLLSNAASFIPAAGAGADTTKRLLLDGSKAVLQSAPGAVQAASAASQGDMLGAVSQGVGVVSNVAGAIAPGSWGSGTPGKLGIKEIAQAGASAAGGIAGFTRTGNLDNLVNNLSGTVTGLMGPSKTATGINYTTSILTGQGDKVLTQTAGQALGNAARDPVQNSFLGTGDVLPGAVPGTWEIEINGEIRAFPTKEAAKAAAKEYAKNAGTPKAYKVTTSDGATHTFYDKKEAKDFADANKIKSVKDVYTVTLEDGSVQEFSSLKAAQQAAQKNSRASAAETWTTSDGKVHASREAAEQYAREKGVSAAPYYMVDGDGTRYSTKAEADAAAQGLAGKPLTADALITKMSAGLKTRGLNDAEINKILYGEAGIRTAATDKALVDAYGTGGTLQGRVTRESDSNKTGLEYLKSLIDTTLTPQTNDAYWAGEQGKAVLTDIEKKLKNLDADGRKAYNEALVSGKYTTVAEAVSGINDAFAKRNEAVLGKVTTNQDGTRTSSKGLMPISFGGVDNWFTPDTYAKIQAQATKTGKSIEDAYKAMSKEGAFNNSSEGYTIIRDITYTAPQSQKSTLDYSVTLGPVASAPGVRSFDGTNTPLEIQYEAAGAGFIPEINTTPGTEAYKPKIETQKAVTVEAPEVEYRKGTGGIEFEQVTPDYIADPTAPVPQDIEYNPEHGWTYQGGDYGAGGSIGFSVDEGYTPEAVVQAPEEETRNWAEYVNTQYGSPLVYSDEALKKIRYFTVPKSRKLREAFERLANELR